MLYNKNYYIYMMASVSNVLYIGVTNDLFKRCQGHKECVNPGSFTSRYRCFKLVYFEEYQSIFEAIAREKQLKKWNRLWKFNLIKKLNPKLEDLALKI